VGLNVKFSFLFQNRNVFEVVGKNPKYKTAADSEHCLKYVRVYMIMTVTTLLCGCQKLSKELTTESQVLRSVAGRTYITTKPSKQRTIQFKSKYCEL